MKFTIGNWYRWDSGFNYPDGLKYFKLTQYNLDKRELHYSDRIDNNNKHSYKKDFCNGSEYDKDLVEVSLTEIQPYLPDGHVDKLSKEDVYMEKSNVLTSLPEKWYIAVNSENISILNGWRTHKGKLLGNGWIVSLGNNDDRGYHYSRKEDISSEYKEITFDEFKKWVLKENIPMKEEYNIGDWVVIEAWAGTWSSAAGGEYPARATYPMTVKIENIVTTTYSIGLYDGKYGHSLITLKERNLIRKCLPHEIPNLPSMEKENEDWCIKFDKKENGESVLQWAKGLNSYYYNVEQFSYTYYGIKNNKFDKSNRDWGKILTTEEFYIKIGKEECKFVVGKWYDCECYSNKEKRTIKIEKIENSYIWGDYIQNSTFWKNGCYQISQVTPIKEVSINEIQSYLPDGHPDKKPVIMTKFKIGDKVRCIGNKVIDGGWKKGLEFTITSLTSGTIKKGEIAWGTPSGGGVYFINLELVTSSIPEYVECINNGGDGRNNLTKGKIYKIVSIDNNTPTVIGDNSSNQIVYHGLNHPNKSKTATYFEPSTKEAYLAQNSPKTEKERLLEEVKQRYPIGTRVNSLGLTPNQLISSHDFYFVKDRNFIRLNEECLVYREGIWAEIIHSSKEEEQRIILEEAKRRFPIGCRFRPITQLNGVSDSVYTNSKECYIYRPEDPDWWIIGIANIYCGKTKQWAEIVESPKNAGTGVYEPIKVKYHTGYDPYDRKPSIMIDIEVSNIKLKKSASVTLKNTEKEVVISVKRSKPILIN